MCASSVHRLTGRPGRRFGGRCSGHRGSAADPDLESAVERLAEPVPGVPSGRRWLTLGIGLLSSVLLWASFPPLDLGLLAWVAPVGWLWLVRCRSLPGRRPYLAIWGSAAVFWLALLQGIRLPHPALYAGWLALSLYLACYLPLFVGLTRVAVHRGRWPLTLAAPVVWTGLELARGHLITGISLALLGHTQRDLLPLVQIADLFGAYGVSFLVMLVAALLATMLPCGQARWRVWPLLPVAVSLGLTVLYGQWRLKPPEREPDTAPLRVALLQGTFNTVFEFDERRNLETFLQYRRLAVKAREADPQLDLILWPESTFTENLPELLAEGDFTVPPGVALDKSRFQQAVAEQAHAFRTKARRTARWVNTPPDGEPTGIAMLVGTETVHFHPRSATPDRYNTALLLDAQGEVRDRYYKNHRVMFGEYIPFGDALPWIYRLSPMSGGLTSGAGPRAMSVAGYRLAPSICFESTVPHLIRGQLVDLQRQGQPVDVMVNLTHDGWFWGSSILDLHLACAVFRAIENRRPMLVAANPGLTAAIDGNGRLVATAPREQERVVATHVVRDGRASGYQRWGDVPAGICLVATLVLLLVGVRDRARREARHVALSGTRE